MGRDSNHTRFPPLIWLLAISKTSLILEYLFYYYRTKNEHVPLFLMPYQILCNDAQRKGTKLSPDLASRLFCYVPLHKIWYGIEAKPAQVDKDLFVALDPGVSVLA